MTQSLTPTRAHEEPPSGDPSSSRRRLALAAAVLGAVAVVAFGGWGWSVSSSIHDAGIAEGEWIDVPGGRVRVENAGPEGAHDMKEMPREMMPDMVEAGKKRIEVVMNFAADPDGAGLDFGLDAISVDTATEGLDATLARSQLGEGTMPPGSQMDTLLVVDVPVEADTLVISVAGADEPFRLPVGDGGGHDHGDSQPEGSGGDAGGQQRDDATYGEEQRDGATDGDGQTDRDRGSDHSEDDAAVDDEPDGGHGHEGHDHDHDHDGSEGG